MATHSSMLHIRVDDEIKTQAALALASMGLSVSEAVRLFLKRVVSEQALPIELKVPNQETIQAMQESRSMMMARRDRKEIETDALKTAIQALEAMITKLDLAEEDIVSEFKTLRSTKKI